MGLWYAAQQAVIVVLTLSCARACRKNRNYWPMMVVILIAIAAVYGGSLVGNLLGNTPHPATRVVFNTTMILAMSYARWFIGKRNRTPRFIDLNLAGHMTMTSMDEIGQGVTLAASGANHGVLTETQVGELEAALAEWHRKQRWLEDARRQVDARRARRKRGER